MSPRKLARKSKLMLVGQKGVGTHFFSCKISSWNHVSIIDYWWHNGVRLYDYDRWDSPESREPNKCTTCGSLVGWDNIFKWVFENVRGCFWLSQLLGVLLVFSGGRGQGYRCPVLTVQIAQHKKWSHQTFWYHPVETLSHRYQRMLIHGIRLHGF